MLETQLAPAYDLQGGLGRSRWAGSLALGCASSESWEESSPSRAFSTLDSGSLLGDTALWGPVLVTTGWGQPPSMECVKSWAQLSIQESRSALKVGR